MSFLIDKYNIINTNVFSNKDKDVLLENILTNKNQNFDLEILIGIKSQINTESNYQLVIKNIVKKYCSQLKYQLKKKNMIDIKVLNKMIYEMMNRIQLIHFLTKKDGYKRSEKIFGDINELKTFASDFKNIILDEENIKLSIFQQLINDEGISYGVIKNLKVLDSYYSFYEDFLDLYSTFLVDSYNIEIPKSMKHLYLTLMLEIYEKLYKFKSTFKSERYLIDFKMKILNTFSEFMEEENVFNKEFIVANPIIIGKIFKMSEDINYKTDLFLNIFVVLDKDDYLSKNITKVFDFVIKLTQKLDKVKTNFIKKILMVKMLGSDENIDIIVDNIISGNICNRNTLELISVNDMTVNHFHELIKKKITPLIINREITTTRIVDLVNLFRNSKFNRLSHDLEIIQNDFTFSKFFTNNVNKEFSRDNNIFVINPNFWALNFSEGFIEMPNNVNTVPKKDNNIIESIQLVNDCYNVATDDKRKFNLLAHIGSINFDYTFNNETLNVTMLPIQGIIFQQILGDSKGEYSVKRSHLYKNKLLNNYNRNFIDEVIDSLLHGGIVKKHKSPYLKSQNFLCAGTELSTMENNYVEILFGERIQESIKYTPVFDSKTVISCWINKFLKTREYEKGELLAIIKDNLDCGSIVVTDDMYNNTVRHMKDNDYIEEKDGKLIKLFY